MFRLKNLIFASALVLAIQVSAQSGWVDFMGRNEEAPPASALIQSDNNTVFFTVQVNGMNRRDMKYQKQTYQRLSIPYCDRTEEEGLPEVPVITQLIAVPDCDDVMLSVMPSGELEFSGYHVCPAPRYERRESIGGSYIMEEVFEENVSAYNTNSFYPQISGEIIETGYVREQKVVRVALYPVQFNPIRKELKVFTDFHVSLTFVNPVSPVNKELGIFRNMMHHTALNYELSGISASTRGVVSIHGNNVQKTSMVTSGSVNRVTNLDLLVDPNPMPVDYLIITHSDLFNSSYLTQLANHRKDYNGFDVVICYVDENGANDIYHFEDPPGTIKYPSTPSTRYISIRDFIADVYDNGKADHTYDGKLGYIVLVGDAYKDDNSTEMVPANYYYTGYATAGDYYYACTDGNTDKLMDLMYGRISVGNETELANVVNKTIAYEQSSSGAWRNNITFISLCPWFFSTCDTKYKEMANVIPQSYYINYVWRGFAADTAQAYGRPNFTHHTGDDASQVIVPDEVDTMQSYIFTGWRWGYYPDYEYGGQYDDPADYCGMDSLKDWFYDQKINTEGQLIVTYQGHGGIFDWGDEGMGRNFGTAEIINRMSNSNKYPFIINCGCSTGKFDNKDEIDRYRGGDYTDCISEVIVNEANKGAIGCLSSTRDSNTGAFGYVDKKVLKAQFEDLSHIMGEAVMESKLKLSSSGSGWLFRRQYNLYGDPAVNLWPYGFTATEDITLSGTNYISTDITINSGVTLTILPGAKIVFTGYYSIKVLNGGKIIANGTQSQPILFTLASGASSTKWKYIQLKGSGNSFKYCKMEKALYPIYVYWTTSTPTNSFENCEFCYNTQNGIKISSSSAHIKSCNIHHNSYYGINSYNSPQIDVEGTHIHHNNRHGVFSQTGCHLKFYGSVIEYNGTSSSYHGVRTRNYDHFEFGQPDVELDDWKGYNTIRENTGIEIQVYNGSPNVDLYYSSIYDDSGLEVYNYSGNQAVEADYCYWGSDEECDHSGSVEVGTIIPDIEDAWWTGNLYTGGLGKVLVYENSSGVQSKESRIEELKAIIESDPSSLEAEHALVELYFIIRDDYVSDKLGEKQVFYDFLKDIDLNHGDKKIVKKALSFMIFWKMLEHDNVEVIKLSKKALEKLDGDDHMFVLEDLAITYAYVGYIQKARKCLVEIKEKYAFDEEGIEFVEEAIAEAEEMVRIGELLAKELTDEFEMILDTFTLLQNYPNPGNPTTNIIFSLAEPRRVELRIFNILGQEVRSLVNDYREAGAYSVIWNGKNNQGMEVPSGIYLYRLRAGDHVFVKKLTLLK